MLRWTPDDRRFMRIALALARRGQGRVEPNPMVGCIIVKNGRIVGQGCHRRFGEPHAEPDALADAGAEARGATVYVTLEPCNHTGKTPPCTDALIRAKVRRVVAAMKDPNPIVTGRGFARLRAAGIGVAAGLLRDEASALNAPFIKYHLRKLPYVILKWAQSIDGKIATRTGDSKWITSLESRRAAHALRARVDAVIIGVETVLADDPELTARLVSPKRVATRIVLDSRLRTPLDSKLVRTARQTPTVIVMGGKGAKGTTAAGPRLRRPASLDRKRAALERAGCEVLVLPTTRSGIRLPALLRLLHARQMTNVLVEGGGKVLGAFLEGGLADEAFIFVAPKLIGGEAAPGPLRNSGPASMGRLPRAKATQATPCGHDLCYNVSFDAR